MANITNIVDSVIAKVNTHTTDIATKADATYVDSEIDAIPSSLSKVASNVLLSGNLALASSAVTKCNANITYTGNGSTQSITTGIGSVDFTVSSNGSGYYHDRAAGDCIVKNDAGTIIESGSAVVNVSKVHIKGRSEVEDNLIYDGIRGYNNHTVTNSTAIEVINDLGAQLTFSLTGFTVLGYKNNRDLTTYIAHQTLYTHIKWGLTSQGKRYITAYNPVTREVMTMYQGSGVAGHQIPNALGIKLDYSVVKCLDLAENWHIETTFGSGRLNSINAFDTTERFTLYSNYIEINQSVSETNGSNNSYISYGFANSETKIITQYQGTGAAGNFVETTDVNGVAKKPRRVITKIISATDNWVLMDTKRGIDNYLRLNLSDAEGIFNHMDINSNGFTFKSANQNNSGSQFIAIVEFDTTASNDDTYFDLPTDDTTLNVTAGKLPYTDGRDATNGAYNVFTQSYTGSVDFSTCPDGIHYVALDSNNTPKFYKEPKVGIDGFNVWFDKDSGKWYEPYNLVTNGDFKTVSDGEVGYDNGDGTVDGWDFYHSGSIDSSIISNKLNQTTTAVGDWVGGSDMLPISTVSGQSYIASFSVDIGTASVSNGLGLRIQGSNANPNSAYTLVYKNVTSSGTYNIAFTANSSISGLELYCWKSSAIGEYREFYNISVTPVEYNTSILTELSNPVSFIDDKPYQVASGTPMDRLVDYPSIPKNVMESSYVDGDLEVSGEIRGKNQCTAWVNFDGQTTPPTIRDSFNVRDVVRVATADYEIHFEEDMDNVDYVYTGGVRDTVTGAEFLSGRGRTSDTVSKVRVITWNYAGTATQSNKVMLKIFGGKN